MEYNYDEYTEWPTLNVNRPTKGAVLRASNGKVVAYVTPDGRHEFLPNMEGQNAVEWEAFGIHDPMEMKQLESAVNNLINQLAKKNTIL